MGGAAATGESLNPLQRVLDRFDLLDHPAGSVAVRERQRAGGRLDPNALREILRTGDVPAGTRRLAVREYSQLVSPSGGGSFATGRQESSGTDSDGGLVSMVEALDQLDRVRSRESGGGAEEVAAAVSESISPVLKQISQTQQQLVAALQDDDSEEVEELREELRELRRAQREDEIDALRAELESLKDRRGYEVQGDRLPEDSEVAREYLQHKSAQEGLSEISRVLDEKIPAPPEWGDLLSQWKWTMANSSPPPAHNAPGGGRPFGEMYEYPDEREAGGAAGRGRVESLSPGDVRPDAEESGEQSVASMLERMSDGGEVEHVEPEDVAGGASGAVSESDEVAELWESVSSSTWECQVCGAEWRAAEAEPCPSCGDRSASRTDADS